MPIYLDTSAAVPAFVHEAASERVLKWMDARAEGELAISRWVTTELASAVSLKLRMGLISPEIHGGAIAAWTRFTKDQALLLEIESEDFEQATSFCRQPRLNIRAGDALHLAVAQSAGCSIATLDEGLAEAARRIGIRVEEL